MQLNGFRIRVVQVLGGVAQQGGTVGGEVDPRLGFLLLPGHHLLPVGLVDVLDFAGDGFLRVCGGGRVQDAQVLERLIGGVVRIGAHCVLLSVVNGREGGGWAGQACGQPV